MAPRHAPKKQQKERSTKRSLLFVAIGLVVCVGIAAVVVVATRPAPRSTPAAASSRLGGPFTVLATTPTNAATVDASAAIRISLSDALSPSSPLPSVSPVVAGSWERLSDTTLEFVQQAPFAPGQTVTVTIPGGTDGLRSSSGAHLTSNVSSSFEVAQLSLLRVQQLLAQEDYLPVTFTTSAPSLSSTVPTTDQLGNFAFRWTALPSSLTSQWEPGVDNVVTKGAIMRFEDVHHLRTDGVITAEFDQALLADAASGATDPDPYTYVSVSKALPESLQLWSNGQVVYTAAVNTGIPGQDTADGTYPVYLRYVTTTMSGTNPDGTKYHDEGIPWTSYFNGGDALHGFIRPGYGWPQSLGCVEMSFDNAHAVWNQTPIGTLVTVA